MAIRSNKEKEESKVFPRWLAQTLSQNLNIKYDYFLRERRKANVWISWGKAAENSCKSLLTFITQFKYIKIKEDPHWKFRAIYSANLVNKVALNASPQRRIQLITDLINKFARKQENHHPENPIDLRMVYLEGNRINCFVRDLKKDFETSLPKNWIQAARRNYLRMLRTDFTFPKREFSGWDLSFRYNRAKLDRLSANPWRECIKSNLARLKRAGFQ